MACLAAGHAGVLDMFSNRELFHLTLATQEPLYSPQCVAHASAICLVGTGYLLGIFLDPLKCNGSQQIHKRFCEPCIVQGGRYFPIYVGSASPVASEEWLPVVLGV